MTWFYVDAEQGSACSACCCKTTRIAPGETAFCPSDYGPAEVRADGLPTIGRPIFATLHAGRRRAGWEFRAPVGMTLRLVDPYTRPVADRGVPAGRVLRVPAWRLAVEAWLARAISQFNRGKAVFASKKG